jgi:phage tail sheath gpL-like
MRIAILAEANTANQANVGDPQEVISAQAAGELYGYGSPAHQIMRILRPAQGGGVGSIPTVIYPQEENESAAAAARTITVTGSATANVTHTLVINGRTDVDGASYNIAVESGDAVADVAEKIAAAINAVLGAPCSATSALGVVTATSKWAGVTSEELTITVNTNGNAAGLTYAVASDETGSGDPDITDALAAFGNDWNTLVVNSYNISSILNQLETFNGIASVSNPTGRYGATTFKPLLALFGSKVSTLSAASAITDGRKDEMTNVLCPAPGSAGFSWEAAANAAALFGPKMQNTPHLDISGESYPDMPAPSLYASIGEFGTYDGRDAIVKVGSSTVDLINGKYQVQDFVSTYHPVGENPAQFRYPRNIVIDWNIQYGLRILELQNVIDHAIAGNDDIVEVANVVKPKQWKQVLDSYALDLASRNLIVDAAFLQDSILIQTGDTNPDRLETTFRYKRSPYARVVSTTVEAGFAFGLSA